MRSMTTMALTTLFTLGLIACDTSGEIEDEELLASAEEAIVFIDDELAAEGLARDVDLLDDERLIEEAREIARFAIEHGCEVRGVLGGIWVSSLDDDVVDGSGTHRGRWFKLDRSIGGDLAGTYTPADERNGGAFDGDWESTSGLFGTLAGDYYDLGDGHGAYLGDYTETDGDAAGMLGGLWYRLDDEGGVYFGVWGQCGANADEIDPESY
ncbi:MAG: hypothetical protein QGH45_19530 [Myxococcota bacterium]|jgi:hypothetical protein|nr:hypothetical protein [Myxococcota bacterium]